ncbi:transposase (plasmid) [Citricoccus nitrophenolicus]
MSLKQRLYPDPSQVDGLLVHLGHARLLYNLGLEQRSAWNRSARERATTTGLKGPNLASQCRQLTQLRQEIDWLRAGSTVIQQGALRDLDRAFTNFFEGRTRYPRPRRKNDSKQGFTVRDLTLARINRKWATVMVPKVGPVRFRLSYPWHQTQAATSARITRHNGTWHVALTTPPKEKTPAGTGTMVGIDVGVANTLATSDGAFHHAPGLREGEQSRFLALQRRLSRQTKGSQRRARTLTQLAGMRRRLENRSTDWIEQTTTTLARTHDLAAVEDLRITNMVRRPAPKPDPETPGVYLPNRARAKAGLNKAILASCWGRFTTRLDHKMDVVRVDPRNTSRHCPECGHTGKGNRESQAVFACTQCGHQAHADTNAAINILARAQPAETATPNPGTPGARTHQPNTITVLAASTTTVPAA